ncbi:hypothetical protein DM793_02570 [Paenarthrobacter nitroguajacolicus]|uniref:DoxX family protein n=1 Tax=Paenarthrobacter nitroguajacolicus TaxID=211146 RepID=UPI0015B9A63A|nr:hypothetical protein [Paenarthrobacter nitroguajacolicus]NWL10186.1 hypothetical protein [Paenarthrobacter nitroguajacolicus]
MSFRWSAQATRTTSALALSALLLASAAKHFRTPRFYYPVVPDYLCRNDEPGSRPNGPLAVMSREEWVASSGLLEVTAAVGLLLPATRCGAANATTAMFTAFLAGHIDALRRAYGPNGTAAERRIHTVRLPLQIPLILWSWSLRK